MTRTFRGSPYLPQQVTVPNGQGLKYLRSAASFSGDGGLSLISPPSGYGWTPPVNVYWNGVEVVTDYDHEAHRPATVASFYVDPDTGSDANPGTSVSPFMTPNKALASVNALAEGTGGAVYAKPGTYYGVNGWYAPDGSVGMLARTMTLEPWGDGDVVLARQAQTTAFVPVLHSGSIYKFTGITNTLAQLAVIDRGVVDAHGLPDRLDVAASLAAVVAGSAYHDLATSTLYFRTRDSRAPAVGDIIPAMNADNYGGYILPTTTTPITFWAKGVKWFGGRNAACARPSATNKVYIYAEDCEFIGAGTDVGGWASLGEVYSIFNRCGTACGNRDGFNYHSRNGSPNYDPRAVEIDCYGGKLGTVNTANQVSTIHDQAFILRAGGDYIGALDQTIADVGAAQSWNVGCRLPAPRSAGSIVEVQGTVKAWLDRCTLVGHGSIFDLYANSATSFIYYTNMDMTGVTTGGAGTVEAY